MTAKSYRGTYVIERQNEDGEYEVLLSVSEETTTPDIQLAYDILLHGVSQKIEKYRPMLDMAVEDIDDVPVEVIPNSPTIRSVESQKEN